MITSTDLTSIQLPLQVKQEVAKLTQQRNQGANRLMQASPEAQYLAGQVATWQEIEKLLGSAAYEQLQQQTKQEVKGLQQRLQKDHIDAGQLL